MGAGVHGGFGNTNGYKNAIALGVTLINTKDLNDKLADYAKNIKEEKGFYDVIMHGKEDSFLLYHPDKVTNKINVNVKAPNKILFVRPSG